MKHGIWCVGIILMGAACMSQKGHDADRSSEKTGTGLHEKKKEDKKAVNVNQPVTVWSLHEEDKVTDNDFTVEIFPTAKEDVFKISIRYGGNTANDELTMLPKSYYDKIALKKGENNNECILGFIDKKGKFNKMKSITASGTSIEIKTLKAYYLSTK